MHRRTWENKVKMGVQKVECGTVAGLMCLRMGEVAGTCECTDEHWVLLKAGNFLTS
jgi:hypothetical protein